MFVCVGGGEGGGGGEGEGGGGGGGGGGWGGGGWGGGRKRRETEAEEMWTEPVKSDGWREFLESVREERVGVERPQRKLVTVDRQAGR